MTEAMPFLQKTILLSYDPRSSGQVFFLPGAAQLFVFSFLPLAIG